MVLVAGFASCADEYKSYTPATADTDQVYFSNDLIPVFELADFTENQIVIPVTRQKTNDEITVQLGLIDESNFYTLQTKQVTFPAGASKADAIVTFDATNLEYDQYPEATIYIVDGVIDPEDLLIPEPEEDGGEEATPAEGEESQEAAEPAEGDKEETQKPTPKYTTAWGDPTFTFSVGVPAPFESIGTGVFTDNFWEEGECEVEILHNTINPSIYRIVDPYGSFGRAYYDDNRTKYLEIQLLEPGDKLWDTEITMSDLVFFPVLNTGYLHSSYGAYIKLYHPAYMYDEEASYAYNKVVAYKDDGTPGMIQLAPFFYMDGVGGWNHTTEDNIVTILFPGFTPKDYALEILYKGIFNDTDENPYAVVAATMGEDVETVKAVVIEADADLDAVADAIQSGELEASEVDMSNLEFVQVPIPEDLTGKLQVILVVVDADGKTQTISSANFEYYGKGDANPWESLGIGLYTDNFIGPLFTRAGEPIGPYEVEVQQNKNEPGLYRLVDPYANGTFVLTEEDDPYTSSTLEIDATDPEGVIIYPQFIGIDYSYGNISIASAGGGYAANNDLATLKEKGYLGTLSEGVITLPNKTYTYTTDDGEEAEETYQGFVFMGSSSYHVGVADGFQLVLPSAVTSEARKRAQAIMSWTELVNNFGHKKATKKSMSLFTTISPIRSDK